MTAAVPRSSVTVEENGGTMTITLVNTDGNRAILENKQPTLTVACDYARAVVTDPNGVRIESTLSGGKISFTVTMGGKYTITRIGTSAPSRKPAGDGKTDEPQPDDGTYVNPYPDVQEGDWYSGAVQFVTEEKLMTGTGKGFEPNAATTRAMLWTILTRMDGADTNSTGAWYVAAQDWAVKHGVSDGTSQDGKITRDASVRVLRDNIVIHEGKLGSLQRFKDAVKEVAAGYECGMSIEKFNDIKEGDIFECFVMEQIKE